ncbi:MAG: hypothetical protein G01um101413_541 [Parcubacteria group bacterium Gr01-1014_13]|nr:MAG: hypothetical protein G01um101413_541 [Parcubacteria group bacterium Gr01-1014_13]
MSLLCGVCKYDIREGYGLIYGLQRSKDGDIILPDMKNDIVPPNCAVCDGCFGRVPEGIVGPVTSAQDLTKMDDPIYVYAKASSGTGMFGAREWSSIQADDNNLRPVQAAWLKQNFAFLAKIIANMAKNKEEPMEIRVGVVTTKA